MVAVAVVVVVVVLGADVLHLVAAAALGAALDGAVAGDLENSERVCQQEVASHGERPVATDHEPDDIVRVSGVAGAAGELFLAGGADHDGVLECACPLGR